MLTRIKTLFTLVFFSIFFISYSQEADKTVSITVSGSGKTKNEAKQSALKSAIEQALDTFISSKTEKLNDQAVANQLASVSSGNIQTFSILNEFQLPDGKWSITIKAIISLSSLKSYVESKGFAIEIKGGLFALNIKQQILKEKGEIKTIREMVGFMHEPLQTAFDYSIKSSEPKSLDAESKNWGIPIVVEAIANKNMELCANYFIKTLTSLSLTPEEIETYRNLNKKIFPVEVQYEGDKKIFYLRKIQSIFAISAILNQWKFYTSLFKFKTVDWKNYTFEGDFIDLTGNGESWFNSRSFSELPNGTWEDSFTDNNFIKLSIGFLRPGSKAGTFSWLQKLSISEIELIEKLIVEPRGIVSKFKFGGYVVTEENGHGLIASISDIGVMNWENANKACSELEFNDFDDWRLPSKLELKTIHHNLGKFKNGALIDKYYWSSTDINGERKEALRIDHYLDWKNAIKTTILFVRAVRNF
jgi:hypothetical protein